MIKKNFSIRRFETSDVGSIIQLLELAFKRRFSVEWWNWKYRLNPAGFWGDQGDIMIAEDANQVIGHLALLPQKIKLGPNTVTAVQILDLAVHPDYRKLGVFETLWEKLCSHALTRARSTDVQNRYSFFFAFPNEIPVIVARRWNFKIFRIVEFLKFLNYDRPLRSLSTNDLVVWSGKTTVRAISATRRVWQSLLLRRYSGRPVEIQKVERFPDKINAFWKVARSEYETVLERTATFLNWRFSKHFGNYQIYIARSVEKGDIVGYLVLRKTQIRNIQNILDIVDLHALPQEDKCMLDLINEAVAIGKNEGLDLLRCRIPRWHKYSKILYKLGFVSVGRTLERIMYQPTLIMRPLVKKARVPEVQEWFYTLADADYG